KTPLYLLRHLPATRPPESTNRIHPQPCLKTRVPPSTLPQNACPTLNPASKRVSHPQPCLKTRVPPSTLPQNACPTLNPASKRVSHPQPCLKTRVLSSTGPENEGGTALVEFLPEEALLHSYLTDKLDMAGIMAPNEGLRGIRFRMSSLHLRMRGLPGEY
ncbi:hypothetical protein H0H92_014997, partial [Tricholoma furcatifolium]